MSAIEELLKEYRGEVNVAASSFYAWKNINNLAANDTALFQALQRNALSWNLIVHALQIAFFSALGRLFDRDKRSLTARTFISQCEVALSQFSKPALEARRLASNHGVRPDYLDGYLLGVYEPVAADFQALADAIGPWEAVYNTNYQPIRNKLIAHKDVATIGGKDSLFAKTKIEEVEAILEILHQVAAVVEQLFNNGRLTNLIDHKLREEEYVRRDLESLLRKVAA
ncbi:hypothetical protein P3W85_00485 [Cupriavidus basilensis]|uniref:HEPN AbiU2-like domain-containing protein n=1 Tax=Cupriavidus basilensis TaxID=68895 RepID=A0ABT6AFS6_9BURK|nr:hypothetical protein [Cupriavidus basilensis]MDF3831445.1 hypothetical protein [Cupriavidus basilensis]